MAKEMLPGPTQSDVPTQQSGATGGSAGSNMSGSGGGKSSGSRLTSEVRNIASGKMLGTLCIAIFDAPDPKIL